jgi:integrase
LQVELATEGGDVGGVDVAVRYRTPDGTMRRESFDRMVDARRRAAEVETEKATRTWPDPKVGRVTFGEWTSQYLAASIGKRATTRVRDETVLRVHALPHLGSRPLDTITQPDVQAVVSLMTQTLAPKTVRTNYGVIRAVLQAAVDADLLVKSPCRKISLPELAAREIRFLDVDELHRLADAMPDEYRVAIYLAGAAGLRWSEMAGLRVGRVDLSARRLEVVETCAEVRGTVQFAAPKSKASRRTIPLPGFVVDEIGEHLLRTGRRADPSALVVQAPGGGPVRKHWSRRFFAPAVARAGLAPLAFHELRHTYAGLLIAAGAHPKAIQERMGHSTIAVTFDVYGHVLPKVDETLNARLDDMLRGRVAPVERVSD